MSTSMPTGKPPTDDLYAWLDIENLRRPHTLRELLDELNVAPVPEHQDPRAIFLEQKGRCVVCALKTLGLLVVFSLLYAIAHYYLTLGSLGIGFLLGTIFGGGLCVSYLCKKIITNAIEWQLAPLTLDQRDTFAPPSREIINILIQNGYALSILTARYTSIQHLVVGTEITGGLRIPGYMIGSWDSLRKPYQMHTYRVRAHEELL